jgi:hypothetical protein
VGFRPSDAIVILFVIVHALLVTRQGSWTFFAREVVQGLLILGGAHFAATRARGLNGAYILKTFAALGAVLAAIAIFEAVRRWPMFQHVTELKGIPWTWGMNTRLGFMRAIGPFSDPITFSLFLAVAFLASWNLVLQGYRKATMLCVSAITLAGLLFTFSRTGGVALLGGLVALLIIRKRLKDIAVVGLLGGLFLFANSLLPTTVREASTQYRLDIIPQALHVIRQNPLTGDNMAVQSGSLDGLRQGQGIVDIVNTYIGLALNGGLVLVLAFSLIPFACAAAYWRLRSLMLSPDERLLADTAFCQLVAMLCGLAFTSLVDKNLLYVVFFAALVHRVKYSRQLAKQTPRPRAKSSKNDELASHAAE